MLPIKNIPRPTLEGVVAELAEPDVVYWIAKLEAKIGSPAYVEFIKHLPEVNASPSFYDLLHSAVHTPATLDGFAICEALKTVLGWPVDADLVEIFIKAIKHTREKALRQRTAEWTMRTGTRFNPKEGDPVTFQAANHTSRRGKVVKVDKLTASAIVETYDDQRHTVYAENLVA